MDNHTIHLWFTFMDEIKDEQLIDEYKKIVSADELNRMDRFVHHRHRIRFLTGRVLSRTILSSFTAIDPDRIIFSTSSHGRPYLQNDNLHKQIQFSISYTENLVAFALTFDGDIGVDVERSSVDIDYREIAEQYFCPAESQELTHWPEDQAKTRFFQYWTLKESYIKARGYGMNIALDSFSFILPQDDNGHIHIMTSPDTPDDANNHWYFRSLMPGTGYQGALAFRSEGESFLRLSTKKTVPLVYASDFNCL